MAKNLIQDMVKTKTRPKSSRKQEPVVRTQRFNREPVFEAQRRKPRYTLWVVASTSLIFLFFALSFLFAKATINIDPKTLDIALDENFSAIKNGSGGALPFDILVLS